MHHQAIAVKYDNDKQKHTSLPQVCKASHALVHNIRVVASHEGCYGQSFNGCRFHCHCLAVAGGLLKDWMSVLL